MTFDTTKLQELKSIADKLRAEAKAAYDLEARAKREYEAELLRLQVDGYLAPVPLGSILHEWRGIFGRAPVRTGRHGVVQVVTAESKKELAKNKSCYPGEFIVRLYKADGSLGIAFETINKWSIDRWLPDGVTPEAKELKL